MKFYKKPDNSVWAFEPDGSQDSLITTDIVAMTQAEIDAHINPPKTTKQIEAEITAAVQARLDDWAKTRNYDGILSACTYATSTVPKFAAEGQAAVVARDATWNAMYALLEDVQGGTHPMPTGYADVEPIMPSLEWPV